MGGTRTARRVAALSATAALAVGAACAVSAGSAQAAPAGLLSGHVVDSAGRVSTGMTVTLTAWPKASVIAALPNGATVPTKVVAVTHPDASGNYALNPNLAALGSTYTEPSGAVNLDVEISDAGSSVSSTGYNFSAAAPNTQAAATNPLVATQSRPQSLGFNLRQQTATTALGSSAKVTRSSPNLLAGKAPAASGARMAAAASGPVYGSPFCYGGWKKASTYTKRSEAFMNLYTAGYASAHEEVGSSHSLGIGTAVTGGGWSASGTLTVETTSGAGGDKTYTRNYQLRNPTNYAHLTLKCQGTKGGPLGPMVTFYKHRVQSTGLTFLLTTPKAISDRVWGSGTSWKAKCNFYTHGNFYKTQGKNQQFASGVDAPFINLSAHAAYSKNTNAAWAIPKGGAYLCGSDAALGFTRSPLAGTDKNPGASTGGCAPKCQGVDPK